MPAARPAASSAPACEARRTSGRQPGSVAQPIEPGPTRPPNRSPGRRERGPGRGRDCDRCTPPSSRQRSSGARASPRSSASTVSATSAWTATRSRSWISTTTSKVGGALRSRTDFWVRRRRASSSPRVTVWMPPMRSERVGLSMRLSRLLPCAVPMSCTPRSAIVRAAWASSSVPISSMTMTSGMWFSTASIITACCRSGVRTCMRRARPMPGCGMSPSPAISLEVSTMTTRLSRSSARTRAASRSIVVLPMPGRPMMRIDWPDSTRSSMISMVPKTALPTRQVRPTTLRLRLRMALIRCSVRSMPARLSSPKEPTWSTTYWMSSGVISRSTRTSSPPAPPKRASGRRPRSMTTSMTSGRRGISRRRSASCGGRASSRASRSSAGWDGVLAGMGPPSAGVDIRVLARARAQRPAPAPP